MAKITRAQFYPKSELENTVSYPDLGEIAALQSGAFVDVAVMTDAGAISRQETYGFEFALTPAEARRLAAQLVKVADKTDALARNS